MAVAREYGMEAANHLNRVAAHEVGKVEAGRIVQALRFPPVRTIDDWVLAQEVLVSLLGPELMDYRVSKVGDEGCQVHVRRCFANEHAVRAGISGYYECGIFARITGWADALELRYEMTPPLGKCLMSEGGKCVYTFRLMAASPTPDLTGERHA